MNGFAVDPDDLIAVAGALLCAAADLAQAVESYARATALPDAFGAPAVFASFPRACRDAVAGTTDGAAALLETLDGLAKTLLVAAEVYAAADAASTARTR